MCTPTFRGLHVQREQQEGMLHDWAPSADIAKEGAQVGGKKAQGPAEGLVAQGGRLSPSPLHAQGYEL